MATFLPQNTSAGKGSLINFQFPSLEIIITKVVNSFKWSMKLLSVVTKVLAKLHLYPNIKLRINEKNNYTLNLSMNEVHVED
uniref:Uncharacterized protein n=1 Tax=Rhizophora mucronata TaxID=61149 RepID=A0A2P2NLH5_RHIMU